MSLISDAELVPKFHVAPNAYHAALPILTSKFLPTRVFSPVSTFLHNAALQIQIQNLAQIQYTSMFNLFPPLHTLNGELRITVPSS
jgi:hypothetical protein